MIDFESYAKYLTYSDTDCLWSCYATTVGCDRTAASHNYPPHPEYHPSNYNVGANKSRVLKDYALVYVLRGHGYLSMNGCKYKISEGSAFILFPNMPHFYAPDTGTGWDEYWIGFNGIEIQRLHKEGFINENSPVYSLGNKQELVSKFLDIIDLAKAENPLYQLQIGSSILSIIAGVLSISKKKELPGKSELLIEKAKTLFHENIQNQITIEEIAEELGQNPSVFGKTFKNYTGLTPYQYFLHMRINLAKQLLTKPEKTVKEVAYELHFRDQYHFSKLFKSKCGISPSQWKESPIET